MSSSEGLPPSVDVIVLGTGLPEAVVAAACARSGLTVLHLDRNDFYGGDWASFNLKTLADWRKQKEKEQSEQTSTDFLSSIPSSLLSEGESLVEVGRRKTVKNIRHQWHPKSATATTVTSKDGQSVEMSHREVLEEKEWRRFSIDLSPKVLLARGPMVQTLCDSEVSRYAEFKCVDRFLCLHRDGGVASSEKGAESANQSMAAGDSSANQKEPAEERAVSYSRVPCTKGDIFQNELLSMIDKRRLMKFLTFCLQWSTDAENMEEWKAYRLLPFSSFLSSMNIHGQLQQYITDAIGILETNANTEKGLSSVCRFVDSVGRFGSSPFLAPLYGCGELPQCFSRLCAVFGGIYCLGRPIEAFIVKDEQVVGVVADGQRICCQQLVTSLEYVTADWTEGEGEWTERAVHCTDKSIWSEDKEHVSLVNLSQLDSLSSPRLLEVGYEVCSAPKGYYLQHLTGSTGGDLAKVEKAIHSGENAPEPIWSLHLWTLSSLTLSRLPKNVAVVPGPNRSLDYASVIEEAQRIFTSFWPDRDFLPRSLKLEEPEDTVAEEVKQE